MSNYSDYFLKSAASVVQLELIEISHPNFSKTYRIVRNAIDGVQVTHEGGGAFTYEYYPMQITATGSADNLDQELKINLGDTGQVLPQELDAVNIAGGFLTKPVLKYRTYRSDSLVAPLNGPYTFEVRNISFNKEGATLECGAPRLNLTSTGEVYSVDRFPMLKGFV